MITILENLGKNSISYPPKQQLPVVEAMIKVIEQNQRVNGLETNVRKILSNPAFAKGETQLEREGYIQKIINNNGTQLRDAFILLHNTPFFEQIRKKQEQEKKKYKNQDEDIGFGLFGNEDGDYGGKRRTRKQRKRKTKTKRKRTYRN